MCVWTKWSFVVVVAAFDVVVLPVIIGGAVVSKITMRLIVSVLIDLISSVVAFCFIVLERFFCFFMLMDRLVN